MGESEKEEASSTQGKCWRSPHPWQEGWTRWDLRVLPTQTILWLSDVWKAKSVCWVRHVKPAHPAPLVPHPQTDTHLHINPELLACYLAHAGAVKELPLQMHPICISWLLKLISRGQLNYYANPCILSTVSLIWICVYAYWEALISSSFNVSKAPDSFQRIILAVLTSLKCGSWFEKVLTSTICYFSLNNLHFKGNMAFIFEWISVCCQNLSQMSKKKDAGLLLNRNVFIYQRSIKGRVPLSSSRQLY